MQKSFCNPYSHGFYRCAAGTPAVTLASPMRNASLQIIMAQQCHKQNVGLLVLPELSLSGYSLQDLFQQSAILEECLVALKSLVEASQKLNTVIITGLPLAVENKLFNCAAVIHAGRLLGLVPKTYLPNHREFYEKRHFSCADELICSEISLCGEKIPIGSNLVFCSSDYAQVKFAVEICEDLWAPVSPASFAAMAGASVICNLSASNVVIGKAEYRKLLVKSVSGKNICGYVYASAGNGESTTDLAWDGHAIIAENGTIISENERFNSEGSLLINDIDVDRLSLERIRNNSFKDCAHKFGSILKEFRHIEFSQNFSESEIPLIRQIPKFPFVPDDNDERNERCQEVFNIQVQGLTSRMRAASIKNLVIGVSGGLDSTLALLVCCKAVDKLGLSRRNIIACTMPGFATSDSTRQNAIELIESLGARLMEIDIRPSCLQMLKDLNHPYSRGEKVFDITFENVQAGERTSHLFRLANAENAIVTGTGDLSELALGWCTYGVGDHMSHYNVNASIPKTLVRYLIKSAGHDQSISDKTSEVLHKVLATAISPELIPGDSSTEPAQLTESSIGPYELQDFNLYYLTRFGFKPSKTAYLSYNAWGKGQQSYSFAEIKKWLALFVTRFFGQTQFKRSCVPDSPKVGSGGSLSPRGDWRAPSDAPAEAWLNELNNNTPDLA